MTNFLISQIKKLELVQEIFFFLILKKAIKKNEHLNILQRINRTM